MGKVMEKKKKKGRPSLLDLQKRSIRQQQQQHQQKQKRNPNPNPYLKANFINPIIPNPNPNPNRRFTRRNPYSDGISGEASVGGDGDDDDDDDDDDSNRKRKEKKLKFVLRLPLQQRQRSSGNSSLNSGSDSNAEEKNGETPQKKRKINSVGDGSGHGDAEKGEKPKSASRGMDNLSGSQLESGPTTPLPDKKLLLFILDRLQKKDTYGVFSEPVDSNELPDYHEIIQHPMDFGTVRKKLAVGAYANLENFEKDVYLICSNAMQYNAPDTIYFRQARSIQELAKKNFENLRQDSDGNEPEPKIVRRGRPPTKNLKKPLGRPPLEHAGSEFSSNATLATAGDNAIWPNSYDLRKGYLSDRSSLADASGRTFHGSRNGEAYISWLTEQKSERSDELPGSVLKGMSMKYGKKQFVFDENRRNTYKPHLLVGHKTSVFTTFDGEQRQLMAVGLQAEYGYARSLARFSANIGPVAWKIASKKIERVLPAEMKFGPGWVGENEALPPRPSLPAPSPPGQLLQQPHPLPPLSTSTATPCTVESKVDKSSEKQVSLKNSISDGHQSKPLPPSTSASSSSVLLNRSPEPTTGVEAVRGLNDNSGFSLLNSGGGAIRPRPSFQIHQRPVNHSAMNGFSGGYGLNFPSQMGKLVRPTRPMGSFNSEASISSQMVDMVSRSNNNFAHPIHVNHSDSKNPKLSGSSNAVNLGCTVLDSSHESQAASESGLHPPPPPSWRGLKLQQKPDSVPPDLNVRFQSPGSPSSSVRVDSSQPDLALQL